MADLQTRRVSIFSLDPPTAPSVPQAMGKFPDRMAQQLFGERVCIIEEKILEPHGFPSPRSYRDHSCSV